MKRKKTNQHEKVEEQKKTSKYLMVTKIEFDATVHTCSMYGWLAGSASSSQIENVHWFGLGAKSKMLAQKMQKDFYVHWLHLKNLSQVPNINSSKYANW